MRALLQRVTSASVTVDGREVGSCGRGYLILLGVGPDDDEAVARGLWEKVRKLRVMDDGEGRMNLSIADVGGEALIVSQFTLYAACRRGNRPSFTGAAAPDRANALYERFCELAEADLPHVGRGVFGADMRVSLVNDGPVTIWLDSDELGMGAGRLLGGACLAVRTALAATAAATTAARALGGTALARCALGVLALGLRRGLPAPALVTGAARGLLLGPAPPLGRGVGGLTRTAVATAARGLLRDVRAGVARGLLPGLRGLGLRRALARATGPAAHLGLRLGGLAVSRGLLGGTLAAATARLARALAPLVLGLAGLALPLAGPAAALARRLDEDVGLVEGLRGDDTVLSVELGEGHLDLGREDLVERGARDGVGPAGAAEVL